MARASTIPAKKKKAAAPPPVTQKKKKAAAPPTAPAASPRMGKGKAAATSKSPAKTAAKKTAAKKAAPAKLAAPKKAQAVKAPATKAPARAGAAKRASARPAAAKTTAKQSAPILKTAAKRAPAKTVAVKQAAPRRALTKAALPPIRRDRVAVAAKRARTTVPAAKVQPTPVRPPQTFTVSHLSESDFKADGLRPYALYRDLGIAAATAGLCQAHVIRFIPPTTDEVRKRHTHTVDLQLVYVLKGWIKNEFDGHGEQMMSTGSCWLQPSGIAHTVLEYSADAEVLEIIVPADFATQDIT